MWPINAIEVQRCCAEIVVDNVDTQLTRDLGLPFDFLRHVNLLQGNGVFPTKEDGRRFSVDAPENRHADASSPIPDRQLSIFQVESHVMRNRLQVSFLGMHLSAEGIVAIAAALLFVISVLAAYRL